LNSKCEKTQPTTKKNQTTPQSTITITKEDDFVSYYLKIDDLFFRFFEEEKTEKLTYNFVRLCNFMQEAVIFWHGCDH